MDAPWKIELFGGLCARNGTHTVNRFRTQRSGLLLAYLAYYPRPHPRENLIELLWPGVEISAGRNRLKQEVASLRRQIEPPGVPLGAVLLGDRYTLQLNPAAILTDITALRESVREIERMDSSISRITALQKAAALLQSEFLPGYFEDWVMAVRREMAETETRLLQQLIDDQEALEYIADALLSGRRLVTLDPLCEEHHLRLMRLYSAAGQAPDALNQFHILSRLLAREVGMEPSSTATELARQIANTHREIPPKSAVQRSERTTPKAIPIAEYPRTSVDAATTTSDECRVRLPLRFTRFIGRQRELALLEERLAAPGVGRLVTLTGPGGAGKTRLSLEVAERIASHTAGIIAFVSLAEVAEAQDIPTAILHALPLPISAGHQQPLQRVVTTLERLSGDSLLILDNMEHLVESGGGEVAQELRERLPRLTLLVTSRMPMGLSGEQEVAIPPLPLPTQPGTPEQLLEFAGVALFVDRAQAASQTFQLTERNAAAVSSLCTRLEGIPLAIELAAAWARTLTPTQMLEQLVSAPDILLTSRRKDIHPRQRSLHATLERSFSLLPTELRPFFTRLAIFHGGWSLEALEHISGGPHTVASLDHLCRSSLVLAIEEPSGKCRYRMLEMVRQYADSQLEPEERHATAHRHLTYYAHLVSRAAPLLKGPNQNQWLARLDAERDNIRAALTWALEYAPAEALRLADACGGYWYVKGLFIEGMRWSEAALAQDPGTEPLLRARVLMWVGALAHELDDYPRAEARLQEGRSLFRERGDINGVATCLFNLGRVYGTQGRYDEAEALLGESLALAEAVSDRHVAAMVRLNRAIIANFQRDFVRAEQEARSSLEAHRRNGFPWGICSALGVLAVAVRNQGDLVQGIVLQEECLAQCRAQGNIQGIARSLQSLGNIYLELEDYTQALPLLQESLQLFEDIADRWSVALLLSEVARWLAFATEDAKTAARLFGAAETLWEVLGTPLNSVLRRNREYFIAALDRTLSPAARNTALEVGRQTTSADAVAIAIAL